MSTTTTRTGLYKPADGENVNVVTDLNNNWDKIDSYGMGFTSCTSSTRPSVVWTGLSIYETNTGNTYVSNGSSPASGSWVQIPNGAGGTMNLATVNVTAAASGTDAVTVKYGSDTKPRLVLNGNGLVEWGSGSATPDTNLYRSGSGALSTDSDLTVAGRLTVNDDLFIDGDIDLAGSLIGDLAISGGLSVGGVGGSAFAIKTSDESVTSSTSLHDDNTLQLTVVGNATYIMEGYLMYFGDSATNTKDLVIGWSGPTGLTMSYTTFAVVSNAVTSHEATVNAYTVPRVIGTNGSTVMGANLKGYIVTAATAGTIKLRWSQNNSSAVATGLKKGSWLKFTRIG